MKIRPINLTQFNKEYGNDPVAPFYVLNRSNPNGNIAFNCINELNVTIPVLIPATFIPVDLTTMAPLENLLRSSVLRQILAKGQLVIVRKEEAEEYLTSPRAKTEYQRINNIVGTVVADENIGEEIDMDTGASSSGRKGSKNTKKSVSAHDDFITAMIDRANDNDEDDDTLQREFLTRQHVLSLDDLERLRKEVQRPALTEMILEAIQDKMNEEEEEEEDE
jgi:hypothetical protein